MASAISSFDRRRACRFARLAEAICDAARERPVPLLVLRVPSFERIAWQRGRRAARAAEQRTQAVIERISESLLRAGDAVAHEPDSDRFVVAMLDLPREAATHNAQRMPLPLDCRAVLERLAARLEFETGFAADTGWTIVRDPEAWSLAREIDTALERGARERERYAFFTAVGHELRTPLTSIRGYLETMLGDDIDESTQRRFLEVAQREALRLTRLVEGMFEFSLLDLSADALLASSCDLAEQIAMALDTVEPSAAARDITLCSRVPGGIRLGLDALACTHLFVNVLGNAIKYGRDAGVVRVSTVRCEPFVTIFVDDDGPGVPVEDRTRVFELGARGHDGGRPGSGVGLALVKTIVDRAAGTIRCVQSPLGGARFEIHLPTRAELRNGVS